MNLRLLVISLIVGLSFSSLSYGHGGRTDSNGGHYNRSTGVYHYHNGGYRSSVSSHTYVMSIFHNREFQGLGKAYNSKKECMSERYRLWKQNKSTGWTYGCRRS